MNYRCNPTLSPPRPLIRSNQLKIKGMYDVCFFSNCCNMIKLRHPTFEVDLLSNAADGFVVRRLQLKTEGGGRDSR